MCLILRGVDLHAGLRNRRLGPDRLDLRLRRLYQFIRYHLSIVDLIALIFRKFLNNLVCDLPIIVRLMYMALNYSWLVGWLLMRWLGHGVIGEERRGGGLRLRGGEKLGFRDMGVIDFYLLKIMEVCVV